MNEMLAKMKAKMGETDNAMDLNVDDDLLELEEEVFGKKKSKKKKKNDDSIDLSDLEDEDIEIEEQPKKKERMNKKDLELDDDLAALEKEGLDDVEDDDSEKEEKKEIKKEIKQEEKNEGKNDIYQEKTEKIYHVVDRMKCISVLHKMKWNYVIKLLNIKLIINLMMKIFGKIKKL